MWYEINELIGKALAFIVIAAGIGYGLWYANGRYAGFRQDLRKELQRNRECQSFEFETEFDATELLDQQQEPWIQLEQQDQ